MLCYPWIATIESRLINSQINKKKCNNFFHLWYKNLNGMQLYRLVIHKATNAHSTRHFKFSITCIGIALWITCNDAVSFCGRIFHGFSESIDFATEMFCKCSTSVSAHPSPVTIKSRLNNELADNIAICIVYTALSVCSFLNHTISLRNQ